jgi:hypothetical protein
MRHLRSPSALVLLALVGLTAACQAPDRPTAAGSKPPVGSSPSGGSSPPVGDSQPPAHGSAGSIGPLAIQPASGPVPSGFRAWSVTFVSSGTGFVLGTAPCRRPPCTSVVRTTDGGRTWRGLPAPVAPLPSSDLVFPATSPNTVRDLRFATALDGYAFGGALWTTHDAHTWRRITVGGSVLDLAITGRTAYAVVASCSSGSCHDARLLISPTGRDQFRPVSGVTGRGPGIGSVSTGAGMVTAVLDGATFVRTTDGRWHRAAVPCLGGPAAVVAPASGSTVTAFCAEGAAGSVYLTVRQSSTAGRTWTAPVGPLRLPNGLLSFSAASATRLAVASANPDTLGGLSISADGGRHWAAASLPRTAAGWRYVGARSATSLVALAEPPAGSIASSSTGGRTWSVLVIR